MLVTLGLVALLAAPPSVQMRSPYLDAVRLYGPGTEREAILALQAVDLRDADQVFDELDRKVCAAAGARGCLPQYLIAAGREAQQQVAATWRRLYPRALALHAEALATCDPTTEIAQMRLHLTVLLRLILRIEEMAREQRDIPGEFARVATQGRHLTLWALQYLREAGGLAAAVETFEAVKIRVFKSWSGVAPLEDVDVRLARGALEELRASPDAVAQSVRARGLTDTFARDTMIAQLERRRVETAARVYEAVIVDHPAELEAHLRLARLLLRLGQPEQAVTHLGRVAGLRPDARQAYLAALFLADAYERQGHVVDAIAAYGVAQQNWPGAQSPAIGVARLRALAGTYQDARAALTDMHLDRAADAPERSDPWMGYIGAQAWRLPSGIAALQASFEAEP
jgi:tetratricopeptide (TPR) repeat protein